MIDKKKELIDNLKKTKFIKKDNVYIDIDTSEYTKNFGKQWRDFSKTQVDEFNNFSISKNLLENITFNEVKNFQNKIILEVGCGSGRFTQYLSKYASLLVINDMSDAIFYNHYKLKKNVISIKSDFKKILALNFKFDIIICRGVLQHTPDPLKSIKYLHDLSKKKGTLYFDIYRKPKLQFLNSKYIWRKILKNCSYDKMKGFLFNNIDYILNIRRFFNKIFRINLNLIWDYFLPIYDYKDKLPLNNSQLRDWAILDTLDGLVTKYDIPKSYSEIQKFLIKHNIVISKYNYKYSAYKLIRND